MTIRRIQQSDFADVDALLHTAFSASKRGYHDEAALVAELRRTADYEAALEVVAMIDGHLVGYGLMTAATAYERSSTLAVSSRTGVSRERFRHGHCL